MLCGASEDAAFIKLCEKGDLGAVSAAVGRDPSVAVRARSENGWNGLMWSIWKRHAGVALSLLALYQLHTAKVPGGLTFAKWNWIWLAKR